MRLRSLLYVPANSARFIAKAHERGADAIILDLEDSVPEAEKMAARDGLAECVRSAGQSGAKVFVRINSGAREVEDALAACRAGAFGLVLPKVGHRAALDSLAGSLRSLETELRRPAMPFIALVEDPAALLDARDIAGAQRVLGLSLGGEDFCTLIGAEPTPDVLRTPKLMLHYAARAEDKLSFGLLQSIADYADTEALSAAAIQAATHGFDGATCVHPSAVPVLNSAFSPSAAQIDWAQRVVAAGEGVAAFVVDGKMVDAPVVARARAIIAKSDSAAPPPQPLPSRGRG